MKQNQFEPFDKVLVRDRKDQEWAADFYSHKDMNNTHQCVSSNWNEVIPYNRETKHLLGTSLPYEESVKEPKEYHVWTSGTFNQWFTKAEFENFIKTAVINNKDIRDFHVLYVKHND